MKSPGRMQHDLRRLITEAKLTITMAEKLIAEYEQAHDAGIRSLRSGSGAMGSGGRAKGSHSDPTADSSSAFEYRRLRSCAGYVSRRVEAAKRKLGGVINELSNALDGLHGAWLDTDPDLRQQRKAERDAAREVAEGPAA